MTPVRIYLDNAATSWPKPDSVYAAVDRYQRELGAPLGRGTYAEAVEVERIVSQARGRLARLIGAAEPHRVVFTSNCTSALNLAIAGILRPGDHVVTTVVEHNSVLRPLRHREEAGLIRVTRVGCGRDGVLDPHEVGHALRHDTRLVAVSHASNVTGAIQPVAEIGKKVQEHQAFFLVDAAQSAGHLSLDVAAFHADLLASSGHKGFLGPLGTGFLYVGPRVEEQLEPLMFGGTGTQSQWDRQPRTLPDKYEAGNLNAPGLIGLESGLRFIEERGIGKLADHAQRLSRRLWEGLTEIPGLTLHGPAEASRRVGVVSFTIEGYDPQELALALEAAYRIQGRPGLHCAPLMHQSLGTATGGGTLRLSVGPFNTEAHIDTVLAAMREVAGARSSE